MHDRLRFWGTIYPDAIPHLSSEPGGVRIRILFRTSIGQHPQRQHDSACLRVMPKDSKNLWSRAFVLCRPKPRVVGVGKSGTALHEGCCEVRKEPSPTRWWKSVISARGRLCVKVRLLTTMARASPRNRLARFVTIIAMTFWKLPHTAPAEGRWMSDACCGANVI